MPEVSPNNRRNSAANSGRSDAHYPSQASPAAPESSEIASQLDTSRSRKEHLSPTEQRIMRLLADPRSTAESNAEIAEALYLTPGAVRWHLHNIYAFYEVKSFRGLFRRAAGHAAQITNVR